MALSAPSIRQKRYAGVVAWERGKKIAVWPETSSGVSGLINSLMTLPALVITDVQVNLIKTLVAECLVEVDSFDAAAYSELPEDRAEANKMIYRLKDVLNPREKTRAEYVTARDSFESFLTDHQGEATHDEVNQAHRLVEAIEDVPF